MLPDHDHEVARLTSVTWMFLARSGGPLTFATVFRCAFTLLVFRRGCAAGFGCPPGVRLGHVLALRGSSFCLVSVCCPGMLAMVAATFVPGVTALVAAERLGRLPSQLPDAGSCGREG
jgi:hypothetical protein